MAFDDQDGNELQLEQTGPTFSSYTRVSLKTDQKLIMLVFRVVSYLFLGASSMRKDVLEYLVLISAEISNTRRL